MKKTLLTVCFLLAFYHISSLNSSSQDGSPTRRPQLTGSRFEYASVRFMEERTSIVWPDGTVENVMTLAGKGKPGSPSEKFPKGSDFRMYWLTVAMNIMGQRGFELVHMHDADVVMVRQVAK